LGTYSDLPDHVEAYLVRRMIDLLPDEVIKVLGGLDRSQIEALDAVGEAFEASGADAQFWVFGVH
jgi:hypothetical protein